MSNNQRYKSYDNKFIIGKSNKSQEEYDELIFSIRNIKQITIPTFIKTICSYSFCEFKQLKEIDIPNNSQLEIIDSNAFKNSSIESILIPNSIKKIEGHAFSHCFKFKSIKFDKNSSMLVDSVKNIILKPKEA